MPSHRPPTLFVALVLLSALLAVGDGAILRYTVEKTTSTQCSRLPADHWCKYEKGIASQEGTSTSFVSKFDDSPLQDSTAVAIPFFSVSSMPVYVTSNGFLSFTEAAMCSYFCNSQAYNTLVGNYLFSANAATSTMRGGGGDWPMIGLYVCDLDPSASASASVLIGPRHIGARGAPVWETIEYASVPLSGTPLGGGVLTAQVTIFTNGTIIMRYKSVPEGASASVGLILSETERIVVDTPTVANGISAYRFEPVFDICSTDDAATAEDCFDVGDECGWCNASSSCMATSAAANRCPTLQFIKKSQPQPPAPAAVYGQQKFYDVAYVDNRTYDMGDAIMAVSLSAYQDHVIPIDLNFDFPYFTSASSPTQFTRTLYLQASGMFTLTRKTHTQECNPIDYTCPNGNYANVLLPFQTAAVWDDRTALSVFQAPALCLTPPCPGAIIITLEGSRSYQNQPVYKDTYSFQLYLDRDGAVEFMYTSDADASMRRRMMISYPKAQIGLVRHTIDDPSSVMVPWTQAEVGVAVRFAPASACSDCGMRGYCDEATANCVCAPGVVGEACDRCATGFFGPLCAACPTCLNDGVCNDGIKGEGGCQCSAAFAGSNCGIACPPDQPSRCDQCNLANGHCECGGVCVCRNGWSGPSCNVPPSDPCRPFSLDGCPLCLQQPGCAYCFDSTCYSTKLAGKAGGYTCSFAVEAPHTQGCYAVRQPVSSSPDYGIVTVAFLAAAVVLCIALVALLVHIVCLRRYIVDIQAAGASGGAVNFCMVRRDREVVQTAFMQRDSSTVRHSFVVAVPLEQIPLRQLYENQRKKSRKSKRN